MPCGSCGKNKKRILIKNTSTVGNTCPKCRAPLRNFNKYNPSSKRLVRSQVCSKCKYWR